MPLNTAIWPIEKFRPYANNPRKNDHAVDRMVAVIDEFGFRAPLLVRSDGELIDGHLRLKAAIRMGKTSLPVSIADDMTPEQVRAYRLVVNRSATWSSFDDDLLAEEIEKLMASGFDITLTGFDQSELDQLLREKFAVEKDPEALPELPETSVVVEGDLWCLGPHRLLCGDSTTGRAMGQLLRGQEVSMVWTDPPYNVDYQGKAGGIKNDKMSTSNFEAFLYDAFVQMREALRPGGCIYVAHSEAGGGLSFRQAFQRAGLRFASCLIWRKSAAVMSRGDYHWQHEPILYGWKPGAAHKWHGNRKQKTVIDLNLPSLTQNEDGTWQAIIDGRLFLLSGQDFKIEEMSTTVIDVPKPVKSLDHPTTKPVALVEKMVSNSSPSGGLVLDSFGGSGSTLMACEVLGRRCATVELDPKYAQRIIMRWQNFSGNQAFRESDGRLFDDLLV